MFQDLLKDAIENGTKSVTEIPYFDGDYWPNILEECIKEQEQEEDKRRREEVEAANVVDMEEVVPESEECKEARNYFTIHYMQKKLRLFYELS